MAKNSANLFESIMVVAKHKFVGLIEIKHCISMLSCLGHIPVFVPGLGPIMHVASVVSSQSKQK